MLGMKCIISSKCDELDLPLELPHKEEQPHTVANDEMLSLKDLQNLLHATITQSAIESLKESQQIANDFAKILVLDILSNADSRSGLGVFLHSLFKYESVRSPTRDLIYFSLILEPTLHTLHDAVLPSTDYWFTGTGDIYMCNICIKIQ